MQKADEKQMIFAAIGVVVFSIAAFVVFIINISQLLFYVVAAIALILGFYLSYNLSRTGTQQPQQKATRSGKGR